ncbi:MAG: TRAP transporter small permease subunit [Gammaproteobacteria bacterium]|nr:TRAP transporter small permease subunit [Gammaproteobacteria bacterium]MDH5801572.1 TRAP transporter small permease subunit [Gammaproteobacteria bacterium]
MKARISKFIEAIENISEISGRLMSWTVLLLVLIVVYDVFMRFFFKIGSVTLQELEWHLFALLFLIGAAYTFKHEGHVRVDIFYRGRFSPRHQAWVDLLGFLFFLLPFCVVVIISSMPFVSAAFYIMEGSPDPGGLPMRFILKSAIPLGFSLLLLQGFAHFLRRVLQLFFPETNVESDGSGEVK